MTSPWHFVLPSDHDLPSGGNRYNEQLIRALRGAGQPVEIVDFATYREALATDSIGYFFVDSLFVRDLALLPQHRPAKTHTVFVLHHLESMDPPLPKTQEQCETEERAAFIHVDSFLVTSSFSEHYLRERRISQPIIVVEPGITMLGIAMPGLARPGLARPGLAMPTPIRSPDHGQVAALMVANLVARKGILPWLQTLATVTKATDAFTLTIVGRADLEPDYAEACQQFARQQPLLRHRVHFTGALPHAHVEEYYARAQLLVSAARMETFGMALQEAKAYRVPLLILAGGYAEQHVTSDYDGYVFNSLTEIAEFFVDLVRSPERLAALQANATAQRPAIRYGWDEAAQRLMQQLGSG